MNTYRVTVLFTNVDTEGQRYTDRITSWVDAASEQHACLLVGSLEWFEDDTSVITNVRAVIETN